MRLIDADELIKRILEPKEETISHYGAVEDMVIMISDAPTVDPVKHGNWLLRRTGHGHYWECSACNKSPCIYITEDTNYCPNCGAKMDEEEVGQ